MYGWVYMNNMASWSIAEKLGTRITREIQLREVLELIIFREHNRMKAEV